MPVGVGCDVAAGALPRSATTPVCVETAWALPSLFDAVTRTRIVCPTSAATRVYVSPVVPEMSLQEAPALLQRCHV